MLSMYIKVISLSLFSFPKWVFTGHNHLDIIHFQKFYPQMLDYTKSNPCTESPQPEMYSVGQTEEARNFWNTTPGTWLVYPR